MSKQNLTSHLLRWPSKQAAGEGQSRHVYQCHLRGWHVNVSLAVVHIRYPFFPNNCCLSWDYRFKYCGIHVWERPNNPPLLCTQEIWILLFKTCLHPEGSQSLRPSLLSLEKYKEILTVRKFPLELSNELFPSDFNLLLLICKKNIYSILPPYLIRCQKRWYFAWRAGWG